MARIAERLARIEKRAGLAEGPRLPLAEGMSFTGAEIRALFVVRDGRTRGLPSERPDAPRPAGGTIH